MCTVSMITDYGRTIPPGRWTDPYWRDDFSKLYERAREYDRDNGEPECELEDKQRALQEIARQMGVEIVFPKKLADKLTITTTKPAPVQTGTWTVNSTGVVDTPSPSGASG